MKKTVRQLMSTDVQAVHPWETLDRAAQVMWEKDCGCVPVVDAAHQLCGMLTDRDVCMAAYSQGRKLSEISVESACSKEVHAVTPETTVDDAEAVMRERRVRRLPVKDKAGAVLGILSIADLASHLDLRVNAAKADGLSPMSVAATLEAVSGRRAVRRHEALTQTTRT